MPTVLESVRLMAGVVDDDTEVTTDAQLLFLVQMGSRTPDAPTASELKRIAAELCGIISNYQAQTAPLRARSSADRKLVLLTEAQGILDSGDFTPVYTRAVSVPFTPLKPSDVTEDFVLMEEFSIFDLYNKAVKLTDVGEGKVAVADAPVRVNVKLNGGVLSNQLLETTHVGIGYPTRVDALGNPGWIRQDGGAGTNDFTHQGILRNPQTGSDFTFLLWPNPWWDADVGFRDLYAGIDPWDEQTIPDPLADLGIFDPIRLQFIIRWVSI